MSKAFTASGQLAGNTFSAASRCAPSRPRMRQWLVAAACFASIGVAQAGGNAQFDEAPTQVAMVSNTNTNSSYTTSNRNNVAVNINANTNVNAPNANLEKQAVMGQTADVGTTAAGLLMGATEANPLGILTLGVKAVAYSQIKDAHPVEQPRMWSMYGAFGWGAAANNLCIIAAIATGGGAAVLCPLVGIGAGVSTWNADSAARHRATFDAICKDAQARNPNMVCNYTAPST